MFRCSIILSRTLKTSMLQYKLIKQQKVKQLKLSTSAMHIQEPEQLGVTIERLLNVFTVYL